MSRVAAHTRCSSPVRCTACPRDAQTRQRHRPKLCMPWPHVRTRQTAAPSCSASTCWWCACPSRAVCIACHLAALDRPCLSDLDQSPTVLDRSTTTLNPDPETPTPRPGPGAPAAMYSTTLMPKCSSSMVCSPPTASPSRPRSSWLPRPRQKSTCWLRLSFWAAALSSSTRACTVHGRGSHGVWSQHPVLGCLSSLIPGRYTLLAPQQTVAGPKQASAPCTGCPAAPAACWRLPPDSAQARLG